MRTTAPEIAPQTALKLLQRGRREGQYLWDLGGWGVHAIKHIFLQVSAGLVRPVRRGRY